MRPSQVSIGALAMAFLVSTWGLNADDRRVRISEPDWAPYFFAGAEDSPPGIAKEVIGTCVTEAGYQPDFVTYPIERMRRYVRSGELDIVTFSYREEREEYMVYGQEILFTDSYRPVVRKGSDIEIDSLEDFDDLRLGHVNGLRYSQAFFDYLSRREEAGTSTTLPSTRSALDMLQADRIDVFVGTRTNIEWMAKHEDKWQIEILDFDVRSGDYFVTVTKASKRIDDPVAFLSAVDACIASMKSDGRYEAILSTYR